jgi:hypothetical protein
MVAWSILVCRPTMLMLRAHLPTIDPAAYLSPAGGLLPSLRPVHWKQDDGTPYPSKEDGGITW